jgi:hypothetical protein
MASAAVPLIAGGAPGPLSVYMNQDLNLRLTAFNSAAGVTLTVTTLLWDAERGLQKSSETIPLTTARLINTRTILAGEGWLLGVQVVASAGTPRRGQCFARVEVILGTGAAAQSLVTVLQGYVLDTSGLSYPGSPLEASTSGRGFVYGFNGTDPAAGVEISEQVPTNARWRLISMAYLLVASAAVANRIPILSINGGSGPVYQVATGIAVTASQTAQYRAASGVPFLTIDTLRYTLPLPVDLFLSQDCIISTLTTALDAGDNYSLPRLLVEEWIED